MKKILAFISLFIFAGIVSISVNAQTGAAIVFTQTTHDFGTIMESDGLATCSFVFTNTGDQALVINNVSASCGCTSPGYTKEPIAPGAKGEVKATYNPAGRIAPFDKTLTVTTNGTPARIVLHIKGNVLRKPADLKVTHPLAIGNLRLKKQDAPMGTILNDGTKTLTLETANAEDTPVSFSFEKTPDYITIVAEPSTLQAKQQGLIKITFDGSKKKGLGYSNSKVAVNVGNAKGTIDVSAIVQENLAKVYAEKEDKNAVPRILVNERTFDFGTVAKGKSVTANFQITNEGKADLILYNATSDNAGVKAAVKNVKIKSGKTATIKITYTPVDGVNSCKAYIATNDPANAIYEVNLQGKVIL